MPLLYEEKKRYRFCWETEPKDFPVHIHNALEVCMMIHGSCNVVYENRRIALGAGDVFVAFPNQPHGYEDNKETQRYLMILPVKPYLNMFHKTLTEFIPEEPVLHKGSWEHLDILPLVEQACKDIPNASAEVAQGYFAVVIGKMLSLLKLMEYQPDGDNILRSVLLYVHAHYREPICRRDIAKAIGYNESYISHVFSQALHMGITQYIHTMRIDDAKNLLHDTKMSVTQIAADLGFGSIRNFNRVFLKEMGMTPKEYRNGKK